MLADGPLVSEKAGEVVGKMRDVTEFLAEVGISAPYRRGWSGG